MNALTLVFAAMCFFAISYRVYGLFIANKALRLDQERATPAAWLADGRDHAKTNKYTLYGQHFTSIAVAGPLLGPALAAQFGYLPGALWILIGAVVAGATHDIVVLFASVRHKGRSLARIAAAEISKPTGMAVSLAVMCILALTLAAMSIALINAIHDSAWSALTVFATIPIAFIMGIYFHVWRVGDVKGASAIGLVLLFLAVVIGPSIAEHPILSDVFTISRDGLSFMIPAYGFVASILPAWLLLSPRDHLSAYLKIGAIIMLVGGIAAARPAMLMPALTEFIHGGGPVIDGPVVPFMFITVACGAISGFHAIISAGSTSRMIANERDALFVGYGAMLAEAFVAVMALVAVCTLTPADYFAISASPQAFAKLDMQTQNLTALAAAIQEDIAGRPGGAVTLAAGMAHIFGQAPFMKELTAYWYHFAIMFEAVFILAVVDTGTRIGRFFLQKMLGGVIPGFKDKNWWPGIICANLLFTICWGYLVCVGDISTIWPLFGMSNLLLASSTLCICTAMLIRMNKLRYAWVTAAPCLFLAIVALWAGYWQLVEIYIPQDKIMLAGLEIVILGLMTLVLAASIKRCFELLRTRDAAVDAYGDTVRVNIEE